MPAPKKKYTKKKSAAKEVEVKVSNDTSKARIIKSVQSSQVQSKVSSKAYPVIYKYIYEREAEDMARILKEYKEHPKPNRSKRVNVSGFKLVKGKLVEVRRKK